MTGGFLDIAFALSMVMLVWDCVEVGRNDGVNIVNAVFGSRALRRRVAIGLAGVAVVVGAGLASAVMETARKGIFDPAMLAGQHETAQAAMRAAVSIYISVYLVDTVLLYSFSAFGMPVSTTASLVFELTGAALAVGGSGVVTWGKFGQVTMAIVMSIAVSGVAAFLIQRAFRGAIGSDAEDRDRLLLHGPWVAGAMLTFLIWFMLNKGMKNVEFVATFRKDVVGEYGVYALLTIWALCTLAMHLMLTVAHDWGARNLFRGTSILGMLAMGFAFGQNDLANCASPGLATLYLWRHQQEGVAGATSIQINTWWLLGCGLLLVMGMYTKNAQRVTRAAVNAGSQFDHVALYSPRWCQRVGAKIVSRRGSELGSLAPTPSRDERGKKVHFDALRASVIMAVSASVIAFASSLGLPVSTTYVTFAAVVATGLADRVYVRGDAAVKMGRAVWVVTGWFGGALIALVASFAMAFVVSRLEIAGIALGLGLNLLVRRFARRRADAQEQRVHLAQSEAERIALAAEQGDDVNHIA